MVLTRCILVLFPVRSRCSRALATFRRFLRRLLEHTWMASFRCFADGGSALLQANRVLASASYRTDHARQPADVSILVLHPAGLAAKSLVTKYANKHTYVRVRGLFIGLIIGELVIVLIAMIISLVMQKRLGIDEQAITGGNDYAATNHTGTKARQLVDLRSMSAGLE